MEPMSAQEFDLIVIGAGPAGEKGAAQAAYFGKRVAVVEKAAPGGAVCHTGTLLNYPTLGQLYKYATYDAMGELQRRRGNRGSGVARRGSTHGLTLNRSAVVKMVEPL